MIAETCYNQHINKTLYNQQKQVDTKQFVCYNRICLGPLAHVG